MQLRPQRESYRQKNQEENWSSFYSPSLHQQNTDSAQKLISSSKKLIKQIQDRKHNLIPNRSSKELISANLANISRKKLTTKEKIQGTLKNIKESTTIAQQLLLNQPTGTTQKQQYLDVIQSMYCGKKNRKKGRIQKQDAEFDQEKSLDRVKKSHLMLESQLQKQLVRKVSMGNQKNLSQVRLQGSETNINNKTIIQQQLEQLDGILKSNSRNTETNQFKTNRVSIKLTQKNHISGPSSSSESLIFLSSSSSQFQGSPTKSNNREIMKNSKKSIQKFNSPQKNAKDKLNTTKLRNEDEYDNDNDNGSGSYNLGTYSFREPDGDLDDKSTFSVPKQQVNQAYSINQSAQGQQRNNLGPYYTDYGSGLSQTQIQKLLGIIEKRVRYSTAVIEPIMYQHQREDNNQVQIESRYDKERKDRRNITSMILAYAQKKSSRQQAPTLKLDQFGNKVFVDQKRWKSPGSNCLRQMFNGLSSPTFLAKCCSSSNSITKFYVNHHKNLLQRAANVVGQEKRRKRQILKRKKKTNNTGVLSQTESSENENTPLRMSMNGQEKCLIEDPWHLVKRKRKDNQIV